MSKNLIDHVFVLMMENRSFDHLLGFSRISGSDAVSGQPTAINGLTGSESNTYLGQSYPVSQPADWSMTVDPCHEFPCVLEQLCGPGSIYVAGGKYPAINNGGFVANYAANGGAQNPGEIMKCYGASQLPVLNALAQEFVICDNWYSPIPGPTWPNRFFVHAASSAGFEHSPTHAEMVEWFAEGLSFQNGTIFDRLRAAHKKWHVFRGDYFAQVVSVFDVLHYFEDTSWLSNFERALHRHYDYSYTFIEPAYGDLINSTYEGGSSQHPLDNIVCGEWVIKYVYESIRNSPLWEKSLLLITWDEHGGFFDHAIPGSAVPPGDNSATSPLNQSGFTFDQYGVRLPGLIISPLIPQNLIDHRTYDHTSILSTLESLFTMPPLTKRDAAARSVCDLMSLKSPRTAPQTLPTPASAGNSCPFPGPTKQEVEVRAYTVERPLDSLEEGNLPGFLHVAHRIDRSISTPVECLAADSEYRSLTTRADAAAYLEKVRRKIHAAEFAN